MMSTELLLVNLGTPTAPTEEAVRAFLGEFLADPMVVDWPRWLWLPVLRGIVLRKRPAGVAELYRSIWSPRGSPLSVATEDLAAAVRDELGGAATVSVAYRYGAPALPEAIATALGRADRVVVVPLFPQRTAASSVTIVRLAEETAARLGAADRVRVAELAPDDPAYVAALAARCRETFARFDGGEPEHLVVSFHGIPARVNRGEGAVYTADCERTAAALLAALGWDPARASVTYQSKFGPERWLTPATADTLEELPGRGVRTLAITAPGFLSAGLETLEELGIRGRESFEGAGGTRCELVDAPIGRPEMAAAVAGLVERLEAPGARC